MSNHPVLPDAEDTHDVFAALLDHPALTEDERQAWKERWDTARSVERRRRDYDRQWDASLVGVTRFGQ